VATASTPSSGAIVAGPPLTGSLGAAARQHGGSLARAWMGVKAVLVCDVSGSMASMDAGLGRAGGEIRERRSRADACAEELARLMVKFPGKTAVVAFNTTPTLALGGRLPLPDGGTDLAVALDYVRELLEPEASGITVIVLSDGLPDDEAAALAAGRKLVRLRARLETCYIGPETEHEGQRFLARLASLSGNAPHTAFRGGAGGLLSAALTPLLTGGAA
jgi:Mg-chelatase subunit ChlD